MNDIKVEIVNALALSFQSDAQKARANLVNYLNKSVGVGEHADVVAECKRLVEEIDHANSCLERLSQMFTTQQDGDNS